MCSMKILKEGKRKVADMVVEHVEPVIVDGSLKVGQTCHSSIGFLKQALELFFWEPCMQSGAGATDAYR